MTKHLDASNLLIYNVCSSDKCIKKLPALFSGSHGLKMLQSSWKTHRAAARCNFKHSRVQIHSLTPLINSCSCQKRRVDGQKPPGDTSESALEDKRVWWVWSYLSLTSQKQQTLCRASCSLSESAAARHHGSVCFLLNPGQLVPESLFSWWFSQKTEHVSWWASFNKSKQTEENSAELQSSLFQWTLKHGVIKSSSFHFLFPLLESWQTGVRTEWTVSTPLSAAVQTDHAVFAPTQDDNAFKWNTTFQVLYLLRQKERPRQGSCLLPL